MFDGTGVSPLLVTAKANAPVDPGAFVYLLNGDGQLVRRRAAGLKGDK